MIKVNTFGERLKKVRLERKLTIEKLAELVDTGESTIRSYEKSRRYPQIYKLIRLCNALNVTPDYLLQDEIYYNLVTDKNDLLEDIDSLSPKQVDILKKFLVILKDI